MASGQMNKVPWFLQKHDRSKYLDVGDPVPLCHEDLSNEIRGWKELTDEDRNFWQDSKDCVLNKSKKQKILMDITDPKKMPDGKFVMEIEALHLDYRGFIYTEEADDVTQLERNFWPVVSKLLAHFFTPRLPGIVVPPPVPYNLPEDKDEDEAFYEDSIARFLAS